jgi:hypothetical protein
MTSDSRLHEFVGAALNLIEADVEIMVLSLYIITPSY